jgi:hypothetical protein
MAKDSTLHPIAAFAFGCLLLATCGCQRESDAVLQQRLVGTWTYSRSEGNFAIITNDLTFVITTNGDYLSHITVPQTHSIRGTAQIKNGLLILTSTNRDDTYVFPPLVEHETIVLLNKHELVTVSENSTVTNYFQKSSP